MLRVRVQDLERLLGSSREPAKLLALSQIAKGYSESLQYSAPLYFKQESRDFIKKVKAWYANNCFQAQWKVK